MSCALRVPHAQFLPFTFASVCLAWSLLRALAYCLASMSLTLTPSCALTDRFVDATPEQRDPLGEPAVLHGHLRRRSHALYVPSTNLFRACVPSALWVVAAELLLSLLTLALPWILTLLFRSSRNAFVIVQR